MEGAMVTDGEMTVKDKRGNALFLGFYKKVIIS
jgi:hypothetical protein